MEKNGIGKFQFAKEFAQAILCEGTYKPCNKCESCISFNGENNPDVFIINTEEKSIKTEEIRQLIKSVYEKPIKSAKKMYIINDSEKMTKEAQNTLLKTLEEPPEYAVIILITSNENMLLNTIKSRCAKIEFKALNYSEIVNVMQLKSIKVNEKLLKFADGSAKNAIHIAAHEELIENIIKIYSNIANYNMLDFINTKDLLFKDKELVYEVLDYINIVLLDSIKENQQYINCIKIVEDTKDRLNKNCNYDMTIDNLLLKIWEEINGKYYRSSI